MKGRASTEVGLVLALLAGAPAVAADQNKPEHLYGPPPSWEQYRALAETSIQASLLDPESARITWTGSYYKGEFKPFLEPRVQGYVACGYVNAKNRMGGYTGATTFVTVIDYDKVLFAEIDRSPTGMIAQACAKAVQEGRFPRLAVSPPGTRATATTNEITASSGSLASAVSGLTLRAMPDGAYVGAVASGSPAAAAGLKPGMVIGSVNAIPLAGMGDAMLKVVDAAGAAATLAIVGGTTVKLGGPR